MSGDVIPEARLRDCLAVTRRGLQLAGEAVVHVTREPGGLFNFVLRVETSGGVVFFKQYLDDVPNPTYNLPKIPASARAQLACDVQRIAADATRSLGQDVVPEIIHFDDARCAFLMAKAAGERPLIDDLSAGQRPAAFVARLPQALAMLHQATYHRFAPGSGYANTAFRDFKLGLQYDDVARKLDPEEAAAVIRCKERYQQRAECITHGDLNSRNIIIGSDTIGVIDFEQAHLGAPAYDLAYILCEVLISLETAGAGKDAPAVFGEFLDHYFAWFDAATRASVESEVTQHLAIQTLYRFWGPSRGSWTFYVDDASRTRLLARARTLLMAQGPVSELLEECEVS